MKFTLTSQRRAGDPFGDEGPAVVETNDRPAAAGSFNFARDVGFVPRPPAPIATSDPLAGLGGSGASSGSMASVKITLASQPKIDDPFTGAGALIKTAAVNLANLETEPLGIFDSPVSAPQGSFSKSADAERQSADGVIYRGRNGFVIRKQTVEIDGRKRTVVTWPNGTLVA